VTTPEAPGRLTAVEEQFAEIERLLKILRRRIAEVAEDVRLATARSSKARSRPSRRTRKPT
jgi:hypothetical protein